VRENKQTKGGGDTQMNGLISKAYFNLYYGCMKSGKSEELISFMKKLDRAKDNGQTINYQLFKPSNDLRDGPYIVSRSTKGLIKLPAEFINYEKPETLLDKINPSTSVVGIDELELFTPGIVNVIETLLRTNKVVIGAGLDLDFRRLPFGSMPQLINLADSKIQKYAVCDVCGSLNANLTQRLNPDGSPASLESPIIAIEQESIGVKKSKNIDYSYEARCFNCYQAPK